MKPGDIIGWSGASLTSDFINAVTLGCPRWGLSHVGIIGEHSGELLHFESTTLSDLPCVIQGKATQGVQAVRLKDRLRTYRGRAWHYPLYRHLFAHESERLNTFLHSIIGRPYDSREAKESGGWFGLLTWAAAKLRVKHSGAYFCVEQVADTYSRIGLWSTDDPAKWNPNRAIRFLRNQEILLKPRRLK